MQVKVELRGFDEMLKDFPERFEGRKIGFEKEGCRIVDIPEEKVTENIDEMLELVWVYGQNDFQQKQTRSLMVGDVVILNDSRYRVGMLGFEEVSYTKTNLETV